MKNLIFISFILLVFSCGESQSEAKNPNISEATSTVKTMTKPESTTTVDKMKSDMADAADKQMAKVEKGVKAPAAEKVAEMKDKLNDVAKSKKVAATTTSNSVVEEKKAMAEKKIDAMATSTSDKMEKAKKEVMATKEKVENATKQKAGKIKKSVQTKTEKVEMPVVEAPPVEAPKPVKVHESFDNLLRKHISSSGKVNYSGFKSDEGKLDTYLASLEAMSPSGWSRKKTMAFWINAYNAYTIKLILKNHPVTKITDLHGGKPWDAKWIKLNGQTLSLNNIENDILRPTYKDARIHFAVNCAAKSCPPILNRAWTESNLNSNMEKQAKLFINNSKFNNISADKVELSKIFEWYAGDFGDLITYINKYSTTKVNANANVSYREYDWNLNN